MSDRVTVQLALRGDCGGSIVVSRPTDLSRKIALSKADAKFVFVKDRWVRGPNAVKLALVDVDMLAWLARKERLA